METKPTEVVSAGRLTRGERATAGRVVPDSQGLYPYILRGVAPLIENASFDRAAPAQEHIGVHRRPGNHVDRRPGISRFARAVSERHKACLAREDDVGTGLQVLEEVAAVSVGRRDRLKLAR